MINKLILTCVLFFIGIAISNAQEAAIKNNQVILNGNPILKYEKINGAELSYSSLDSSGDEILMVRFFPSSTANSNDDYYILNFPTARKKVKSNDPRIYAGYSIKKLAEKLINWLLKEKVLDSNGKLNLEKVDAFYEKYNQETETIIKIQN